MNRTQTQEQLAQAHGALDRLLEGYDYKGDHVDGLRELQKQRAKIERKHGALVTANGSAVADRDKLEIELREIDVRIGEVQQRTDSVRAHIDSLTQWLDTDAVAQRKRDGLVAAQRVLARLSKDLPAAVGQLQSWFDQGEKAFTALDQLASANQADLLAAGRVAREQDDYSIDRVHRELHAIGSSVALRTDSLLAWFLLRLGMDKRIEGLGLPRPLGKEITTDAAFALHSDRLAALALNYKKFITDTEEEGQQ